MSLWIYWVNMQQDRGSLIINFNTWMRSPPTSELSRSGETVTTKVSPTYWPKLINSIPSISRKYLLFCMLLPISTRKSPKKAMPMEIGSSYVCCSRRNLRRSRNCLKSQRYTQKRICRKESARLSNTRLPFWMDEEITINKFSSISIRVLWLTLNKLKDKPTRSSLLWLWCANSKISSNVLPFIFRLSRWDQKESQLHMHAYGKGGLQKL